MIQIMNRARSLVVRPPGTPGATQKAGTGTEDIVMDAVVKRKNAL